MRFQFASQLTDEARATFAERLLRLRDALLVLPPESYDHSFYKCATTCCALGWAASLPDQFGGLELQFREGRTEGYMRLVPTNPAHLDEEVAADAYFGPGAYEAIFSQFAFGDNLDDFVTRDHVAARIARFARRRFVEQRA